MRVVDVACTAHCSPPSPLLLTHPPRLWLRTQCVSPTHSTSSGSPLPAAPGRQLRRTGDDQVLPRRCPHTLRSQAHGLYIKYAPWVRCEKAHTFCYWAGPTQLGYCLFLLQPKPLTESSAVQAGHVIHIGHVQFGHAQRLAVQLGPYRIS